LWLLGLFTAASFIETVFWGQMSAFTPLYLPQLGIAPAAVPTWTGITAAVSAALGIPLLPFWGALADRYSRQPVIVRSFVAHVVAGTIAVLAGNVWVFVLGRAIMGFAQGNSGLMMTTLTERVPQRRVGLAFAVLNSSAPVGAFLGPLIGGPVVDHWGFRALLVIDVCIMVLVVLGMWFGYRDTFHGQATGSLLGMAAESVAIVARSPRLRVLFPALFLLFGGWVLALTYVPLAVTALYHGKDPGTAVGFVVGAGGLVAMVLGPVLGALSDRFGLWRVLLLAALVTVGLWPVPAFTRDVVFFGAAYAVVNGLMSGVFAVSFSALSSSADESTRARVMSFAYLPVNLGSVVGPVIGSVVTRASVWAVFPAAAVFTAGGVLTLAVARRQKTSPAGVTREDAPAE
jgi:MFS family permease